MERRHLLNSGQFIIESLTRCVVNISDVCMVNRKQQHHSILTTIGSLLTSRGVVWDTLQFLDDVDVQQLKGQEILGDEQQQTALWEKFKPS